jgi:Fur family transcriptional regulator, ferric uptake regulator
VPEGATPEQAIRATGRRLTMQRAKILDALRALDGHQAADAIYAEVARRDPRAEMALSTVYRTLDTLVQMGLVASFDDGTGTMTYEWSGEADPHHHLLCDECGHVKEVPLRSVGDLEAEVEREHGFAAEIRHLAIRGQCAGCRDGAGAS